MGIDIQVKKGCSFFIVDEQAETIDSGWVDESSHVETAKNLYKIAQDLTVDHKKIAMEWGHPLKGRSREKTPLPLNKYIFFRLSSYFRTSTASLYHLFSHPLFLFHRLAVSPS